MNTMAAFCGPSAGLPGHGPRPGVRHVPGPPAGLGAGPAPGAGATGAGRPRARASVRLTRRGRLVALVLLLMLAALVAALAAPASRAADPPGARQTAVVRPGDTLWSVAERHRPGRDPFGTIDEIRRLNGLTDYTIQPGQRLTLPPRR
jgi:LysM repeat protein